jgi:hypothetical protein
MLGLGYGLDDLGFNSKEIMLFSKMSRWAVEPTQPPIHWVSRFFFGVKVARA